VATETGADFEGADGGVFQDPFELLSRCFAASIKSGSFVKLSFLDNRFISNPPPADVNTFTRLSSLPSKLALSDLKSATGRIVELKDGLKFQLQLRYLTNDKVFNFSFDEANDIVEALSLSFKRTSVVSKEALYTIKNHKFKTVAPKKAIAQADVSLKHDRQKNVLLSPSAPFLHALKITTAEGRPKTGMSDKLRQIQRFVEILDGLVERANRVPDGAGSGDSTPRRLSIVDMGSGLAYLTFAVHDHFSKAHPPRKLTTTGVEARESLVKQTQKIANELKFEGLSFVHSTIEGFSAAPHSIDVLMALHACDTATDDAIFHGITSDASVIVVSPCCHKEARAQMDKHFSTSATKSNTTSTSTSVNATALGDLLRHNLFRERESEMVTDAVRTLLMEMAGYDVSVVEFVAGEHTAKNVMLAAVKRRTGTSRQTNTGTGVDAETSAERARQLMATFGVKHLKLATLLGVAGSASEAQQKSERRLPLPRKRSAVSSTREEV